MLHNIQKNNSLSHIPKKLHSNLKWNLTPSNYMVGMDCAFENNEVIIFYKHENIWKIKK